MAERMWFFARNNQQEGPIPESQLQQLFANQTLHADTLVWSDNLSNWTPASQLETFIIRGTVSPQVVSGTTHTAQSPSSYSNQVQPASAAPSSYSNQAQPASAAAAASSPSPSPFDSPMHQSGGSGFGETIAGQNLGNRDSGADSGFGQQSYAGTSG